MALAACMHSCLAVLTCLPCGGKVHRSPPLLMTTALEGSVVPQASRTRKKLGGLGTRAERQARATGPAGEISETC